MKKKSAFRKTVTAILVFMLIAAAAWKWSEAEQEDVKAVIAAILPDQDISAILDAAEPIMVKTWVDEWDMLNVSVASQTSACELGSFGCLMDAYAIRRTDGRSFVMVTCDYMSDDYVTFVCEVTGGDVRLCCELGDARPAGMPVSPERIPMVVSLDVLGSYNASMAYDLDSKGNLVQAEEVFTIDRNYPMTVRRALPVTVNGENTALEPGKQIIVTGTNNVDEVYFRVPGSDMTGTICYTLDENDSWIHLIDGVSEYEYLDGLPYAG